MTSVFVGGPTRWQTMLWALLASLSLHLAVLAFVFRAVGSAGDDLPRSATAAVVVTLHAASTPLASQAAPAPASGRSLAPDEPAALSALRGHWRLAAYRPPYLEDTLAADSLLGPWYFSRSELTVPAALQDEPLIQSPVELPGDSLPTGKVVLRVFIGVSGAVEHIEASSSELPPVYVDAAVAAFSPLRFRPGEIEGVAVRSEARFEIAFDGGESPARPAPGSSDGVAPQARHHHPPALPRAATGARSINQFPP